MNKQLQEETIIFVSVLNWFILASLIGVIVGLATTGFLKLLSWSIGLTTSHPYYYFLMPVAFFLSALMIKYLAPDAEGHGTEKVIEAVHKKSGKIKAAVVPIKIIATIITIASGGSVGKEGPCAQIGAGLASIFSDIFRFDDISRKKLVICGISAGFASVFGTPIAGAIFGIEVLFVGSIMYEVLLPSFIAGMTSYHISSILGITYFYKPIALVPVLNESIIATVALAGVFFGLCSFILVESLRHFEIISHKLKMWPPLKGLVGGTILIFLTLIFSTKYLGLGLDSIENILQGKPDIWYSFLTKIVFTSITLSFGGSGGIATPIFFIGSSAGAFFANLMDLDVGTYAAIGFVSVLAGAANAPLAASIMAVELFGAEIAPYAAISCVISFVITGHRSVYPSQIFAISKAQSIEIEIGKEEEWIQNTFKLKKNSFFDICFYLAKKIKSLLKFRTPE